MADFACHQMSIARTIKMNEVMTPQEKNQLELTVGEEVSLPDLFEGQEKKHSALDWLIVFAKHKVFIFWFVVGAFGLSIAGSLLLPTYYTGEVKLLPPQQGQSMGALVGELGQLGGLLGAVSGKDLLKNPGDLYAAMLHSRTIADNLIDRFSLMSSYKAKKRVDAYKRLESLTEISVSKVGIISISVEDRDPKRAAEIANGYVEELEKLTKVLAVTDASKRRVFFEHEAKAASDELATAETELKQTEERTGVFEPSSQTRVMLEAYAELKAQVTEKEVEIESMRSFATPENPDLKRAEQQLAALQTQVSHYEQGQGGRPIGDIALEKVPAKALDYIRKWREMKYRESLWQLLVKQYEVARIDEGRDAAIIQVLDKAVPPERKSSPKRAIIVLAVTFLALLFAVLWVSFKEALERDKHDPGYLARLRLLKFYLSHKGNSTDRGTEIR
jgi:tyrosine-protein kinase Etk/Wzc